MKMSLFVLLICVSILSNCNHKPESGTKAGVNRIEEDIRKITPADIKTGTGFSTPVISYAQKFIIPVPALGRKGEPLVYPKDAEKAGQPIVDYQGKLIG